jgi:hypothetical protein
MLHAPDWQDVQFVSACMLLLIAAYWGGQTMQSLIESIRAGNYDGPDYDADVDAGLREAPLPIDIDRDR